MKTTLDLPEKTLRKAKIHAASQGTTLKALVTESLEAYLRKPSPRQEANRKKEIKRLLQEMQAENQVPMKPLSRNEAHER